MTEYPEMYRLQRAWAASDLSDVPSAAAQAVDQLISNAKLPIGAKIGVAVGSRGIVKLVEIVQSIVLQLRSAGFEPFLIPAMGSHGGATSQGQTQVLRSLGIDPDSLQVPCLASMETTQLGITPSDVPVHFATAAKQMDAILICNRIKPHTRFTGQVQSGLLKMLTIGLGKKNGAGAYHQGARTVPFDDLIHAAAEIIQQQVPILGGIAILENQLKQVAEIEAVPASQFETREPELLEQAMHLVPRLPIKQIDLLIVDEIGKEISGTGMDTNVIGRKHNDHVSAPQDWCKTSLIYVRGLSPATRGNATGIGIAEFTTPEVVKQVDWQKTNINAITSVHPTAAMCPLVLPDDRAVLEAALSIVGETARIVHIRNTAELETVYVSASCLSSISNDAKVTELERADNYDSQQLQIR